MIVSSISVLISVLEPSQIGRILYGLQKKGSSAAKTNKIVPQPRQKVGFAVLGTDHIIPAFRTADETAWLRSM